MKIKTVAKHYFTEPSIWIYIIFALILGYYAYINNYLQQYWYLFLVLIIVAPFYEWFAHKYILHLLIGNTFDVPKKEGDFIGKKFSYTVLNKPKKVEILTIKEQKATVGYGLSKRIPFFRAYMERLHIGHHTDPTNIKITFAPTSIAFLLFTKMFLLTLLFTFNYGMAVVFTFATVVYYIHYEWMHLGHHIPGYKHIFPWSNKLKTAHQLHHYRNENYWWGITNILGDIVLGTYPNFKEVKLSKTVQNINHNPELEKK
jgi:hypothetical protein